MIKPERSVMGVLGSMRRSRRMQIEDSCWRSRSWRLRGMRSAEQVMDSASAFSRFFPVAKRIGVCAEAGAGGSERRVASVMRRWRPVSGGMAADSGSGCEGTCG